jgi:hypothetical protein
MNFNHTTHQLSLGIMVLTALYTLVYGGLTGLLLCSAVALLIAAFVEPFELVAAGTVLFVLFYIFYLKRYLQQWEPFQNPSEEIAERIHSIETGALAVPSKKVKGPSGVYDSAIEGFEDIQPDKPKEGAASESSAASTSNTVNQVDEHKAAAVTQAIGDSKKTEEEEVQSATGALFKKGKLPSEDASGPKLDAGKTIMKAMESFDPATIGNMTKDTKSLVDTQKNLISMLNEMRPALREGQQLLQTFGSMFNNGGKFELA